MIATVEQTGPAGGLAWLLAQPTAARVAVLAGNRAHAEALASRALTELEQRRFGWPLIRHRVQRLCAELDSDGERVHNIVAALQTNREPGGPRLMQAR